MVKGNQIIRGFSVPRRDEARLVGFADDTTFLLQLDAEGLQVVSKVLLDFCKVSGHRINWSKTSANVCPDCTPLPPPFEDIQVIQPGVTIKQLGFPLSPGARDLEVGQLRVEKGSLALLPATIKIHGCCC
eukprot:TRINITY_DN3222_c0_g1_i1.p1 TRINITY_DN3222_c0_g1~~TRINITY_DN3222_c0_g1_i1.p1  ORF type:complete len:130 (+),score=24.53 TRINITY_DN3222_c0_g1_i1:267-656(+)